MLAAHADQVIENIANDKLVLRDVGVHERIVYVLNSLHNYYWPKGESHRKAFLASKGDGRNADSAASFSTLCLTQR